MIIGGKERKLYSGVYHGGVIRVADMDKVFRRCTRPCSHGYTSSTCMYNRGIADHHSDDDWNCTWCARRE